MLPIRPVTRPACLAGLTNGRLPDSALWETPGQAGGATVRLTPPAARAWRALCAAALAAGHVLKPTSLHDSYRPVWVQEETFRRRYTTEVLAGQPYRVWNGVHWYLRPGFAPAAVPGWSNHGWGLAVDTGEERDTDTGTESLDAATLAWLVAHELDYGWSHELESEPWHIRYTAGDAIPAAVLAHEQQEDDMALRDDPDFWYLMHRVHGIQRGDNPIRIPEHTPSGTPAREEPNHVAAELAAIREQLARDRPAELAPGTVLVVQSTPAP